MAVAKRDLARTGLRVTTLGYGAMELRGAPRGRDITEAQAETILNKVLDAGINYIDTPIGGIVLHSPELSRHARPLNRYLRQEAGLGGRVRELAILTTARELDSQFEWAAHEPEAIGEGMSREIIKIIKYRKDTNGLDETDAIVIELGREIFGARKVGSTTFARALRQFGRRALVDLVALIGNYAGTAAPLRERRQARSGSAPGCFTPARVGRSGGQEGAGDQTGHEGDKGARRPKPACESGRPRRGFC